MKSIRDPSFKHYPSIDTDVRRTFQRIRDEMRQASIARFERQQPAVGGQGASVSAPGGGGRVIAIG